MSNETRVVRHRGRTSTQTLPRWAYLERELLDSLDVAWRAFDECYSTSDGSLAFAGRLGIGLDGRDGVDDFYEPFFNWPHLYLLGGSADVLTSAKWHWEGVTLALTKAGMLVDEYERGYDWFHQGESLLLFYFLCLADPADTAFAERATRFAELFVDPAHGNYSATTNLIVAPHVGAGGARPGFTDTGPVFPWSADLRPYGLPVDVPGVSSFDDLLADPQLAHRYGAEMSARMSRGDVAVNMAATTLVTNAFMLTGDSRLREWVIHYLSGWLERSDALGGVVPDNVGTSGVVGEHLDGRWFGGHYGWSWPHGLHSVGTAAVIASQNALLLGADSAFEELGRRPIAMAMRHAERRVPAHEPMSMPGRWRPRLDDYWNAPTLLTPYRVNTGGWFDFQPMQSALPVGMWHLTGRDSDLSVLNEMETGSAYSWSHHVAFRDKEEAGHEEPWFAYLDGRNPAYPETALAAALQIVRQRTEELRSRPEGTVVDDFNEWQRTNPVLTEVLMQLTCGAPQVLYNGGLMQARVVYLDAESGRPGLPADIGALVRSIDPKSTTIELANLSTTAVRHVVVQAGAFGEHRIDSVRIADKSTPVHDSSVIVELEPRSVTTVHLAMTLRAQPPTYLTPARAPRTTHERKP